MKYYSTREMVKVLNVTAQTLRNWDSNGKLVPHHKTDSGYRYYSEEQLNKFLGITIVKKNRKTIGYCRVSSNKQKEDLERQIENVKLYMLGRGINYNKKGFNKLVDLITDGEVEKIVLLYKDRLLRFGYELIENLCKKYSVEIEIIDNTEKIEQEELVEDLVQIVTVFSCRLQGKRANRAKQMIKELISDDSIKEDKVKT
ncbi:IS607 family transposase [Cetobacterium sp. 2G large]|uniref:IS607 family transposase n=1 Tax=Cetobacterium sp. 2G large TaxID=2759680 RepID=UPI00163C613D|nr:IS607 family transposase [Cetobacterium sp. 2G large]MBC2854230.1 IS607 family transposase [Cetobacterium sp. 2G large]